MFLNLWLKRSPGVFLSKTFTMHLMGGLGNQMFQVAAAFRISEIHNASFDFDVTWYHNRLNFLSHDSQAFVRRFPQLQSIETKVSRVPKLLNNRITSILGQTRDTYYEKELGYNEHFESLKLYKKYIGYFQSHLYFPLSLDIQSLYSLPWKVDSDDLKRYQNEIAFHFRLGDYLDSDIHPIVDRNYIEKGVEFLCRKKHISKINVFSDSPELVSELLPKSIIARCEIAPKMADPIDQLIEISKYSEILGSSSSFSWWAGYLNPLKHHKSVVVPSAVLKNTRSVDLLGRYPKSWTVI